VTPVQPALSVQLVQLVLSAQPVRKVTPVQPALSVQLVQLVLSAQLARLAQLVHKAKAFRFLAAMQHWLHSKPHTQPAAKATLTLLALEISTCGALCSMRGILSATFKAQPAQLAQLDLSARLVRLVRLVQLAQLVHKVS
jgi:hypothetical protein